MLVTPDGETVGSVSCGCVKDALFEVCDARPIFPTAKRFPEADQVVVDWPHHCLEQQEVDERTVIAVLTHDPKFDVPALKVALGTDAGYVGAVGSRRTHEDRITRVREVGVSDSEITRIHSPVGLDIGGQPLAPTSGPIHPGAPR
jgi:xanthine dehydrogenase accessory factor